MARRKRLYAAVSAHGFGHIAQTAPVVNALRRHLPDLHLTLHCGANRTVLQEHFHGTFEHIQEAVDFGFLMADSLAVRATESHQAYADFFGTWQQRVAAECDRLQQQQPDLVLANIPFLTIAAASQLGLPTAALCSLNWADIYHPLCREMAGAEDFYRQMAAAYGSAAIFLQPAPSMPMPAINNQIAIGPIARLGTNRRTTITAQLGIKPDSELLLLSLGGIPTDVDLHRLPRRENNIWLITTDSPCDRPDIIPLSTLALPFIDVLSSVDGLITKPGYGYFAEAACNGIPVLSIRRSGWPESEALLQWLKGNGRCLEIDLSDLNQATVLEAWDTLRALPLRPPLPPPSGIEEGAAHLLRLLS